MAEEFQAEICGGNWWNPSRSVFSAAAALPCSMAINHDVAGFGWPSHIDHMVDNTARSNSSGETNNSVCESPNIAFQEVLQKPHHQGQTDHLIDSTLQMMGFGLSASDLSQLNLVQGNRGRSESNSSTMYSMLQEEIFGTKLNNYRQEHQTGLLDSSTTSHHQIQALSSGFPASTASFGYNPPTLLQSMLDGDSNLQAQPPFCGSNNNNRSPSYSTPNYGANTNTSSSFGNNNMVSSSWPRNNISAPKQSSQPERLHFSNTAPFWNASDAVLNDDNIRPGLNFPSSVPQLQQYATPSFEQKPKCNINANSNLTSTKPNMVSKEDVHQDFGSSAVKKSSSGGDQPVLKRARIETPSPLPTFKVRKEKLGDRITALQQLVSPFGKTDTASVLHEAIEYIKFLHDQVSVLSTPYMKNGALVQGSNKVKDQETPKQDLKSRGLCLVPISSTFPVANETTADFWTPTFGGSFR